jgi:hypothetical protein
MCLCPLGLGMYAGRARAIVAIGAGLTLCSGPLLGQASKQSARIRVEVIDSTTRAPIAGASVLVVGFMGSVRTDSSGLAIISSPREISTIRVQVTGYAPKETRQIRVEQDTLLVFALSNRRVPLHPGLIIKVDSPRTGSPGQVWKP